MFRDARNISRIFIHTAFVTFCVSDRSRCGTVLILTSLENPLASCVTHHSRYGMLLALKSLAQCVSNRFGCGAALSFISFAQPSHHFVSVGSLFLRRGDYSDIAQQPSRQLRVLHGSRCGVVKILSRGSLATDVSRKLPS